MVIYSCPKLDRDSRYLKSVYVCVIFTPEGHESYLSHRCFRINLRGVWRTDNMYVSYMEGEFFLTLKVNPCIVAPGAVGGMISLYPRWDSTEQACLLAWPVLCKPTVGLWYIVSPFQVCGIYWLKQKKRAQVWVEGLKDHILFIIMNTIIYNLLLWITLNFLSHLTYIMKFTKQWNWNGK